MKEEKIIIAEGANDRIKDFRLYKQFSTRELARQLGMSGGAISLIETGKRKPTLQFVNSLCNKFPELNKDWIISGEGEMLLFTREKEIALIASKVFNDKEIPPEVEELISVMAEMSDEGISALASFGQHLVELENKKKHKKKKL